MGIRTTDDTPTIQSSSAPAPFSNRREEPPGPIALPPPYTPPEDPANSVWHWSSPHARTQYQTFCNEAHGHQQAQRHRPHAGDDESECEYDHEHHSPIEHRSPIAQAVTAVVGILMAVIMVMFVCYGLAWWPRCFGQGFGCRAK